VTSISAAVNLILSKASHIMAPRLWNAYRFLNITTRDSNAMTCVAQTQFKGTRCRWSITDDRFFEIHALLNEMESRPPSEISLFLPRLAQLSLCYEVHQKWEKIRAAEAEWRAAINEAIVEYNNVEELKARNRELTVQLEVEMDARRNLERLSPQREGGCSLGSHTTFTDQLEELRLQLERYHTENAASEAELKRSLAEKSRDSEKYLEELGKVKNEKLGVLASFHSQLSEKDRTIESLRRDLQRATADKADLLAKLQALEALSSADENAADELRSNPGATKADHDALLTETETLRSNLESQRVDAELLRSNLRTVEADYNALLVETEKLRPDLESHHHETEQLRGDLRTAKANYDVLLAETRTLRSDRNALLIEAETLQSDLESQRHDVTVVKTQLLKMQGSLDESRRLNTEQGAATADRDAASAMEVARLLDRVSFLEGRASATRRNPLRGLFRRKKQSAASQGEMAAAVAGSTT
jgi:peptidoglycan hydrolase CwlO-like protein